MRKKYVLRSKKRFTIFIATIASLMLVSAFATTVYGYKDFAYKTVVVKKGDTLWDIAKQNCKEGDIRLYVHKVKEINSLDNSDIYQGTKLILPVK